MYANMLCNNQSRFHVEKYTKKQSYKKLALHRFTGVACKYLYKVFKTFERFDFKTDMFLRLSEDDEWELLTAGVLSAIMKQDTHRRCSFLCRSSFNNLTIMETIPNSQTFVRRSVAGCPRILPTQNSHIFLL